MDTKDVIIKLINYSNFKDAILMCLENDIDFSSWYKDISKYAPAICINKEIEDDLFHHHFNPEDCIFYVKKNNKLVKMKGVVNFYKNFMNIVKFDLGVDGTYEVKPTKPLNDKCYGNWYISTDDDYFSIEYDAHGEHTHMGSSNYYAYGEPLNETETKQYLLNKKLNKLKGKSTEPKKFPKKKDDKKPLPKETGKEYKFILTEAFIPLAC